MISHKYKCVFVHIPKNAGQSIDTVFLDLHGLTWETRAPLLLRYNDKPELGPPRLAHLTAQEYVKFHYLSQELFDRYFTFAFVRNPWSRVVSLYGFMGYEEKCEFKEFLNEVLPGKLWKEQYWFVRPQADFILSDDGECVVDFVGRFENLKEDFRKVCCRLELTETELPYVNKTRKDPVESNSKRMAVIKRFLSGKPVPKIDRPKTYHGYYDPEGIDIVSKLYQRDIENFGYSFER